MLTLDLCAAVTARQRVATAAWCTGALIYLEGIVSLALLTEGALHPAALAPVVLLMGAQYRLVRRPIRLLLEARLTRSYRWFFLLAGAFVGVTWLGSTKGIVSPIMGVLLVALTCWPPVRAMRLAAQLGPHLSRVARTDVLLSCFSFDFQDTLTIRLRSLGGERVRLAAPFVTAALAMMLTAIALALIISGLGFNVSGAGIAQVSTLIAIWAFYRGLRHAKLRASQLTTHDRRKPVLLLREFGDDALKLQRFRPGPSFEHLFTMELDRIGPTISIGKPGERLPPLGAARDYLGEIDWKRGVSTRIDESGLVVFLLGDSTNLLWEFNTTVAARGIDGTLIIIPPLRNLQQLEGRWERFVRAAADAAAARLPRNLPPAPLLAVFFAGEDAVVMVGCKRDISNYRFALRLFGCILAGRPHAARDVETFVRTHIPVVATRGTV